MGDIYRPDVPLGWFRQLDSVHIHLNEDGTPDSVRHIIRELEKKGATTKLTRIRSSIAGPQQSEYSEMYHSHALVGDVDETFKSFSTIRLSKNHDPVQGLRSILPALSNTQGIVIEAERVVGLVDEEGLCSEVPHLEAKFIDSSDVGFERARTLPVEIHYAFNIPKEEPLQKTSLPISLEQLLEACITLDIDIGEWLLLDKANRWAYRSNTFAEADVSLELVKEQHVKLARYLNKYAFSYSIWAMVEHVLGVWKTPLCSMQKSFM